MKNGFVHEWEGLRYYVDDVLVKGWFKIDGDWFYFNDNDGVMKTGFCKIGENTYYFDSYGKCILFTDRIEKEIMKKYDFKKYISYVLKRKKRK